VGKSLHWIYLQINCQTFHIYVHESTVSRMTAPDWSDLHYFLELARQGTLSSASRRLGVEHTTVARRIDRLEAALGAALFDRRREGYVLTETGQALLPHAEAMESGALAASEQLGEPAASASGTVRLGAPEAFGSLVFTPRLPELMAHHPELQIELLLMHRFPNLAAREADLTVTLDPPKTGRYVVTRLTDIAYFLYASPAYLASHPPIRGRDDLPAHDFVDYVQDVLMSDDLNYLDELLPNPRRRYSCTSMLAQYEAVAASLGLAMMTPYVVPDNGRVVRVLPGEAMATRTLWLAAPTDLFRLQRVRVVWDFLRAIVGDGKEFTT
jgi:DNA-binding transcriptional LysR family regulator